MASKTVVELLDDMDGGRADETVRFALDGVEYEIDLSSKHAAALRDTLAVYIGHAHRPAARRAARRAEPPVAAPVATRGAAATTARNGRNGTGKAGDPMTAEIRRLASESAQKVNQARAAAEAIEDEDDDYADTPVDAQPVRPASSQPVGTVGPVPALVIPFMEAR